MPEKESNCLALHAHPALESQNNMHESCSAITPTCALSPLMDLSVPPEFVASPPTAHSADSIVSPSSERCITTYTTPATINTFSTSPSRHSSVSSIDSLRSRPSFSALPPLLIPEDTGCAPICAFKPELPVKVMELSRQTCMKDASTQTSPELDLPRDVPALELWMKLIREFDDIKRDKEQILRKYEFAIADHTKLKRKLADLGYRDDE